MSQRIEVGVLGATGMVGQQFIAQLAAHPWFRLTWVGASERSAGQKYRDAASWKLPVPPPAELADLVVQEARPGRGRRNASAMDASVAGEIEEAFAKAGHIVVSNARNHRMAVDVPLLVPEINSDHLALIDAQRAARGWTGALLTNPNCSTCVILAMALAPLRQDGLKSVIITTLQALSGAGYPGVASLDALGNVGALHLRRGSEDRKRAEEDSGIARARSGLCRTRWCSAPRPHVWPSSMATPSRLPCSWIKKPSLDEVRHALVSFSGAPQRHKLPSAPGQPIVYLTERTARNRDSTWIGTAA